MMGLRATIFTSCKPMEEVCMVTAKFLVAEVIARVVSRGA